MPFFHFSQNLLSPTQNHLQNFFLVLTNFPHPRQLVGLFTYAVLHKQPRGKGERLIKLRIWAPDDLGTLAAARLVCGMGTKVFQQFVATH